MKELTSWESLPLCGNCGSLRDISKAWGMEMDMEGILVHSLKYIHITM